MIKENFFETLGRKIREIQTKLKKVEEKYWKLSAVERIDYDNKKKIIKEDSYKLFNLTKIYLKLFFWIASFFFIIYLFTLEQEVIKAGAAFFIVYLSFIPFVIVIDCFLNYIFAVITDRKMNYLNKRFKLIK